MMLGTAIESKRDLDTARFEEAEPFGYDRSLTSGGVEMRIRASAYLLCEVLFFGCTSYHKS